MEFIQNKKLLIIVGVVFLLLVGGASAVYFGRPKDTVLELTPQSVPSISVVTPSPISSPESTSEPANTGETCSPPGTATCDGQGRPIRSGGGNASNAGGLAAGVKKLTDVGFSQITLSTGGTNGLDIDPETGLVYAVTNSTVGQWCGKSVSKKGDKLSIVDPDQKKEITSVTSEKGPVWPLVDVKNNVVYVAASADGYIALHKRGTGEKTGTIKVGGLPHDLGLNSDSTMLLVSNTNNGSQKYVAAVNPQTKQVIKQHEVAMLPHRIMIDAAKNLAYVVSVDSGIISVFNTSTGQPDGKFETNGKGTIAFSPSKRLLFVPTKGEAGKPETINVVNVDTKKVVGTIGAFMSSAGHQAFGMAVDDQNHLLYVSIGDSTLVGVADINSLKPVAVFDANDCTWGVKLDTQRGRGFVTGVTTGTVNSFDLKKVASQVKN